MILSLNIMHFKKLSFWILALPIYKDYNCDATCLHNEFVFVVDGYMGEWGSWSACSATCGGGYQMRTRTCHDPLFGGKNCTGEVVDLNPSCNTLSCPSQSEALIYSIFFLFEIIFKLTKKREMIIRVPFLMSLFYFILIFVSQGSDSFMTRIKDSKYVFFIFPSLKSVSHFQYTHLFMYWTSNICKNNDLASQTFNFAIQHRR